MKYFLLTLELILLDIKKGQNIFINTNKIMESKIIIG